MKILYFLKTLFYFLIIELVFQFFVMKNEKLFLKRITKYDLNLQSFNTAILGLTFSFNCTLFNYFVLE